jgi:serine/threonine-protein kinase
VDHDWLVCPACLSKLPAAGNEILTETLFANAPPQSSTSADEGRFPAGTVLAGRYRVLGLLGQGGMGEVYKAFDLILNQTVALKFLSKSKFDEAALARFRNEVRVARQVSHPNVCRVYDIGFVEGFHFLSMEYLDGEDLGSLLRRIGRLPSDKATEFTRKICAGLSAAHERGVLHRDLKPANIMIDGRGQVRITDFGLAGLAAEIPLSDLRSGTPAYMSPEQKAGKEVTTRSDIYSLGLVIHEMFTGERRSATTSGTNETSKDVDPAIERLIVRCLEDDPRRRPQSAINVAMALPGADPIAAALAAGETPSPEMVAASQEKEGISLRAAISCFLASILAGVMAVTVGSRNDLLRRATLDLPPEALTFKSQEMLKELGYTDTPMDNASGFLLVNLPYVRFLDDQKTPAERDAILATYQPPVVAFWYRQHTAPLESNAFLLGPGLAPGMVTFTSPANDTPGMIRLLLDPRGRLSSLEARPATSAASTSGAIEWSALLKLAGLDAARFTLAEPMEIPPMAFDARAAFTGTFAEGRTEKVRVEAAAWRGRPVFFNVTGDWEPPDAATQSRGGRRWIQFFIFVTMLLGAALLAWRNLHLGRGDRRGALWVGGVMFAIALPSSLFRAAFVPTLWSLGISVMALGWALFAAAMIAALYLGIEPLVRRNFPDALISLSRLQGGRFRDSLVASHVLTGLGVLALSQIVAFGVAPFAAIRVNFLFGLPSLPAFFGWEFNLIGTSMLLVTGICLVVALLRLLLLPLVKGRIWIADLAAAIAFALAFAPAIRNPVGLTVVRAIFILGFSVLLWTVRRFGLLPAAVFAIFGTTAVPEVIPSWWSGRVLVAHAIPIIVGAWALWVVSSDKRGPSAQTAD